MTLLGCFGGTTILGNTHIYTYLQYVQWNETHGGFQHEKNGQTKSIITLHPFFEGDISKKGKKHSSNFGIMVQQETNIYQVILFAPFGMDVTISKVKWPPTKG